MVRPCMKESTASALRLVCKTTLWQPVFYQDFPIWEKHTIEFRPEAFSVFNHTNFSGVSVNRVASTFGQITSALDPRIFEVALRYQF
jgi:hypothetical protein